MVKSPAIIWRSPFYPLAGSALTLLAIDRLSPGLLPYALWAAGVLMVLALIGLHQADRRRRKALHGAFFADCMDLFDRCQVAQAGLSLDRARALVGAIASALNGEAAGDARRWRDSCERLAVVCSAAQAGTASASRVTRAAMNGCRSPSTMHWLPKSLQRPIVPRFNVWSAVMRVSPDRREFYIQHYLSDIRLLSFAQLRAMFPGARVIRERFWGVTKSLVAMRAPR